MNQLIVPDTGMKLSDGYVVMLARFPGTKWVVHNGWYTYGGQQFMGWYFQSIPANTILPVNDEDLALLTIVGTNSSSAATAPSTSSTCDCHHPGHHPKPDGRPGHSPGHGPGSDKGGLSPQQMYELDRAWISVDTIALRDQLNRRLLPDGKVVRVNYTPEGGAKYYAWNQVTQTWDDINFGGPTGDYLTREEAAETYATQSSVETAVDESVKEAAETIQESVDAKIEDVASSVQSIQDNLPSQIESEVTKQIEDQLSDQIADEVKSQIEDADIPQQVEDAINASEALDKLVTDKVSAVVPDLVAAEIADLTIPPDVSEDVKRLNREMAQAKADIADLKAAGEWGPIEEEDNNGGFEEI